MRKTICVLAFSHTVKDARVLRHLKFLGAHYDLVAIGYGNDPSPLLPGTVLRWHGLTPSWGSKWRRVVRTLARGPGCLIPACDWLPYQMMGDWRRAREIVLAEKYDLFLGNDISPLLIGVRQQQKKGKPFVMDYHEYAPLEAEEKLHHRWFHGPQQYRLMKRYGRRAAGNATVNDHFASRFEKEFGFSAITVMNAPELHPLPPPAVRSDSRAVHLAFHGNAGGDRNLNILLRALKLLDDRFVLHLMLTSGAEAGSPLRALAEALPPGRVVFEEPVPPSQTVAKLAAWDIGFNILQPLNYNHRHALPNKLFDYIHAGLATVCSNTVTGRDFVEKYGIGWVLPEITPESLAGLLSGIIAESIAERKEAALRLRTQIHAAGEEGKLVAMAGRVLAAA